MYRRSCFFIVQPDTPTASTGSRVSGRAAYVYILVFFFISHGFSGKKNGEKPWGLRRDKYRAENKRQNARGREARYLILTMISRSRAVFPAALAARASQDLRTVRAGLRFPRFRSFRVFHSYIYILRPAESCRVARPRYCTRSLPLSHRGSTLENSSNE